MRIAFPGRVMELFVQAAKNRKSSFGDKARAFGVLLGIEVKSLFHKKKKGALVSKNIYGYKVYGYKYRTLQWLFNEVFLKKEYDFHFKQDNPVILDCGSNVGFAILYLKKRYPNATIIGFEPNPHAFEALNKNISTNKLQNVSTHQLGLADEEKTIDFYLGGEGSLVGSINEKRGGAQKFEVKVVKLSDFILQYNPDLVKMDIEGAENLVLVDLVKSHTLGKPKEYIIEYHHNIQSKSQLSSFLEHFEKAGFDYNLKTNYTKVDDFQDIVIHFYKKDLLK